MSTFDPDAFLNTQTTEANETHYTPVPGGDYKGVISDLKLRTPKESVIAELYWQLLDVPDAVLKEFGREKVIVRQSVFLDIENGVLAQGKNKNVQLGMVREALGLNTAGQPFSLRMLNGAGPAQLRVEVKARADNAEIQENRITRVAKIASAVAA